MHACTRIHARTHVRSAHSFIHYLARESSRRPHRRPQHLPRGASRSEAGTPSGSRGGLKMPDRRGSSRALSRALKRLPPRNRVNARRTRKQRAKDERGNPRGKTAADGRVFARTRPQRALGFPLCEVARLPFSPTRFPSLPHDVCGRMQYGSSNRSQEPCRTNLARGTGGGMVLTRRRLYPLFRRCDSRAPGACADIIHVCARSTLCALPPTTATAVATIITPTTAPPSRRKAKRNDEAQPERTSRPRRVSLGTRQG